MTNRPQSSPLRICARLTGNSEVSWGKQQQISQDTIRVLLHTTSAHSVPVDTIVCSLRVGQLFRQDFHPDVAAETCVQRTVLAHPARTQHSDHLYTASTLSPQPGSFLIQLRVPI